MGCGGMRWDELSKGIFLSTSQASDNKSSSNTANCCALAVFQLTTVAQLHLENYNC